MEALFVLALLAKVLGRSSKGSRNTFNSIKRECRFWSKLIKEISQLISIIFKFIIVNINSIYKKSVYQSKVVEEEKLPENVISFEDYKLKKAK